MTSHHAYKDRDWATRPAAEAVLTGLLDDALDTCPPARAFADALLAGCGVRLRDIIDHIDLGRDGDPGPAELAGWRRDGQVWNNAEGMFPPLLQGDGGLMIAFRVECVEDFARVVTGETAIEGERHGSARRLTAFSGDGVAFEVFERNGYAGFDIPMARTAEIRAARLYLNAFRARRRQFDEVDNGLAHTEALVRRAVGDLGPHRACELWLKAEREFWMSRCPAGRLQKARQDAHGIGWANIDHHTYDGSRRHFRRTIGIFETLGYELREMLYAGELAGWGSQVLEQPVIGSTIFADVDLAPHEVDIDFAHEDLPALDRHRRAGVLSVLHGESILEAGLNHVAGLFDQRALRGQLGREGVAMMEPFSAFPHLYQELSCGERAPVDPARVDALEAGGHLSPDEAEAIRLDGAVLSHLENIERNEGFKGFNKPGIDGVLRKLDPRAANTP